MRISGRLAEVFRRFGADRRGNFAMMMAAASGAVMLAAGYGLNTAQIVMTRSNLLNALDSAITSTARDITTGRIEPDQARPTVEAFLLSNGGTGFAAAENIVLDSLDIDKAASTVAGRASVEIRMIFPVFQSATTRTVSVESAAVYSDKKIEVAMMLDVTGSMAATWRDDKIGDLKEAAKTALTAFLAGQDPDNPRVRVALIPYADGVNVGGLANVVHAERNRRSGSEPPRLDAPRAASAYTAPDDCSTEREGTYRYSNAGPYTAMVNRDYRLAACPRARLMPLSADLDALNAAVDGFRAEGHTAGQVGIQWSWYMLSREWASVLPAAARPEPRDDRKIAKYAILMTDGEFNTAYADVPHDEATRAQPNRSRAHAERLCAEMKRQGIEIFTVGFMLRENAAKRVMADCASEDAGSVQHYFDVSTGAELKDAYQTIARNIERLAITR